MPKYQEIIKKFEMKDRPEKNFVPKEESFKELVEFALCKSFPDFNFRTLTETNNAKDDYVKWVNKKKEQKIHSNDLKKTNYLIERLENNGFIDRYIDYFKTPARSKSEFDTWHHETCQEFLNILNGKCDGTGKDIKIYKNLCYGKAQKIINMMFKHLYCCGAELYQEHFKHCHMTLDNFTLEWFKRNADPDKKRIDSWSNLVYEEDSDNVKKNFKCYQYYQLKIREYFEDKKVKNDYYDLTPFQAEFFIWPEIQLHMAAEAFLFELDPYTYKGKDNKKTRENVFNNSIDTLFSDIEKKITNYNRSFSTVSK